MAKRGLPTSGLFPVGTAGSRRGSKARARQMRRKGKLSARQERMIRGRARAARG